MRLRGNRRAGSLRLIECLNPAEFEAVYLRSNCAGSETLLGKKPPVVFYF